MFRRHLSSIIYLTLLITAGSAYGLLLAFTGIPRHFPLWVTICAVAVVGIVISVIADPLTQALLRWHDERQAVRNYERDQPPTP